MATFLYRVGRLAFRRRWYVALAWLAVLGAVFACSLAASEPPEDDRSMPGIEAQQAYELIGERFGAAATAGDGVTAKVVFVAPEGERLTSPANRAVVDALVAEVSGGAQVAGAVDPFQAGTVNDDESTAYATVTYTVGKDELTDATKQQLQRAVDQARDAGLTVDVGGSVLSGGGEGGMGELVGIVIAALVLLVTFGSLVAAGLPLLTAVVGVGVSMVSIIALGGVFGLTTTTSTLAAMLGLAVGIDYALFVVSRYREERAGGHAPREAAGLAVGTAGSAVVFAGLTVVIALAGLSVVGVPTLTKMGLTAAGAVVVAVLVSVTLVPALIGFAPNAVLARRVRRGAAAPPENRGRRWARFVLRHPVPVLVASVLGLGVLAIPAADLQLGMPGDEAKSTQTTERRAYDELAAGFGPGSNGPLTVVVDARDAGDPAAATRTIAERLAGTDGVVDVSAPRFDEAGDTAMLSVTPATSPTSEETKDLVQAIRAERPAIEHDAGGATFQVTGTTATNIDVAAKVQGALVPYLAIVLGLAFLLLLLVFRSLLVPLKAALGFLLSVLASLGAVVAVFQWGFAADLIGLEQTGPVISMMPIILVGITFGLAMDYQVFLVSRIREAHAHGDRPDQAVATGFGHSARVVVAAALIMMAVFSGFVGAGLALVKMIGFGLATAVLFDAFVVRMAIVPAVLALAGKKGWWLPRWLDRILPNVDVEGAALDRRAAPMSPAPDREPVSS